jgi:hypothetical protein
MATNNFFASLRDLLLENEKTGSAENFTKALGTNESAGKGRSAPIVLISEANLISLQREQKCIVSGELFFWSTATGTRIATESMVDYNAIQKFLTENNPHFIPFY